MMKMLFRITGLMLLVTGLEVVANDVTTTSNINGLQLAQNTAAVSSAAEQRYGPVNANESLWKVSQKFHSKGTTMAQLMMSIFNANPDAFVDNNINRLKVGAVLTIPSVEVTQGISIRTASREATAQIETYEDQVRGVKVERGDLNSAQREPELLSPLESGVMIEVTEVVVSEVDLAQTAEMKQELEKEEVQVAAATVDAAPVVKPKKRQRRKKPERPLFRYSYDLAFVNDDNVRLAQNDLDIRDDMIFSATLNARGGKPLDSFTIWNYGASVTYNAFSTFDGLNNVDFNINTKYRFALASGFTSPIYSLGIKVGGVEYDSEMRDATVLSLSADLNKWITNTINMTAGWGYKISDSKSEAYDTSENRLFVNFDTNFSKTDLIYTTFTYITGDVVSSASPTLGIINAADVIEPDDAFGGIEFNQFAYRLDAQTLVVTIGYNKILTRELSLDVSTRFVTTEASADDSIGYDRTLFRASLLGRFK